MALGIGYGLPFVAQHGTNPYKTQWAAALEGAKGAGASVEDENAGTGSCLVSRGQDVYTDGLPFTPSLLIVPQFYKAGNLYQDVPPFVAEDTTMRFTVSRNTTATRVNSSGLIESVASGVPRIDWLGQSCPALLVEPSAQNQALWSRDLSVSGTWVASGITAVRNAVGADGTASGATTLTATAASGTVLQAISHASQSRVFSAYVRRVTGTGAIQMTTNGGTNWTTVTISSLYTQVACAAQTVASGTVGFRMAVSGDVIEVDFTQGEVGPDATSPIPTTAGTGSRSADVISVSGAVSGSIGQTEGTFYFDFQASPSGSSSNWLNISDGTTNNWLFIGKDSTKCRAYIRASNSVILSDITFTLTGSSIKAALAYKSGNYAFYINGNPIASGTTAFTFSAALSRIHSGGETPSAVGEISRYRAVALYTTRFTDAQLAELTRL